MVLRRMMGVVVAGVVVADDDNDDDDRRRFAETLLSSSVGNCSVDALELRKLETSSCFRAFCDGVGSGTCERNVG